MKLYQDYRLLDVTPCNLVDKCVLEDSVDFSFKVADFTLKNWGSKVLRNVGPCLQNYMALYPGIAYPGGRAV